MVDDYGCIYTIFVNKNIFYVSKNLLQLKYHTYQTYNLNMSNSVYHKVSQLNICPPHWRFFTG